MKRSPDIQPFAGLRYSAAAGRADDLLAPPYDVISADGAAELRNRSPHNIVRLELPEDGPDGDRYASAVATLDAWRGDGTMTPEPCPAIYVHEHTFEIAGETRTRNVFYARVRWTEASEGRVKPHEHTHKGPREDRIEMLRRLRTQVSPVFSMYRSKKALPLPDSPPDLTAEVDGQRHRLWVLTDAGDISRVLNTVTGPLYIADGHHRYASIGAYSSEYRQSRAKWTGDELEGFCLMGLVPTADLVVLGTHRVIRSFEPPADLTTRLQRYFEIDEVPVGAIQARLAEPGGQRFGLLGLAGQGRAHLLRGRTTAIAAMMPGSQSAAWRALDVAVLQVIVLGRCLSLPDDAAAKGQLTYTADPEEAIGEVATGAARLALLVNPTRVEQVLAVADAGEAMPQKSTYFYPKLPTGLVLYPFDTDR